MDRGVKMRMKRREEGKEEEGKDSEWTVTGGRGIGFS